MLAIPAILSLALSFAFAEPLRAPLLATASATPAKLARERSSGATHVALDLRDPVDAAAVARAAASARAHSLGVAAWIEVARDPALADARPEWMASLGAHEDWRALFPDAPKAAAGSIVKAWPWVPIGSAEAFEHHVARVRERLAAIPGGADLVFLSGVQGGPSSCGCGNDLCRWAVDYQVPSTATREWSDETLARFASRVEAIAGGKPVIAVVVTECEEADLPGREGACCVGVACYRGLCWPRWTGQIDTLARGKPDRRIGVLATGDAFSRRADGYPAPGGWPAEIARLFREMPPRYGAKGIGAERLVAVVSSADAAGLAAAEAAGFGGVVVAEVPLPQSFEPRSVKVETR